MIEGEDDQSYRVHLLHGTFGLLWARLWGKNLGAGDPTYYDGDEVRRKMGRRGWPVEYWDAIRSQKYEIWGKRKGEETWRPLSRTLVAEERLARMIAAAISQGGVEPSAAPGGSEAAPDPVALIVGEMRDVIERSDNVGVAEAAFHLLKHLEERKDYTLVALHQLGWPDATRDQFPHYRKDGARRIREGQVCRFCPPEVNRKTPTP